MTRQAVHASALLLLLAVASSASPRPRGLRLALLLPQSPEFAYARQRVEPAVQLAAEGPRTRALLPHVRLFVHYEDDACSDVRAPLAAYHLHQKGAGFFLGPVCSYALGSVSRLVTHWNKASATFSTLVPELSNNKAEYRTTFMSLNRHSLAHFIRNLLRRFGWLPKPYANLLILRPVKSGEKREEGMMEGWFSLGVVYSELSKPPNKYHITQEKLRVQRNPLHPDASFYQPRFVPEDADVLFRRIRSKARSKRFHS